MKKILTLLSLFLLILSWILLNENIKLEKRVYLSDLKGIEIENKLDINNEIDKTIKDKDFSISFFPIYQEIDYWKWFKWQLVWPSLNYHLSFKWNLLYIIKSAEIFDIYTVDISEFIPEDWVKIREWFKYNTSSYLYWKKSHFLLNSFVFTDNWFKIQNPKFSWEDFDSLYEFVVDYDNNNIYNLDWEWSFSFLTRKNNVFFYDVYWQSDRYIVRLKDWKTEKTDIDLDSYFFCENENKNKNFSVDNYYNLLFKCIDN